MQRADFLVITLVAEEEALRCDDHHHQNTAKATAKHETSEVRATLRSPVQRKSDIIRFDRCGQIEAALLNESHHCVHCMTRDKRWVAKRSRSRHQYMQ